MGAITLGARSNDRGNDEAARHWIEFQNDQARREETAPPPGGPS